MKKHLRLISGTANTELAQRVSKHMGVGLTPITVKKFNDGETYVRVGKSVRGCHVFVIQSTSPPANDNLMELLIIVDALKRASAKEITVVIPYFGYARQDRKTTSREPITAKLVASMIEASGASRLVTFDLHVDQIQGFFNIPVDNLVAMPILAKYFNEKKIKDLVVVSPDVGGATRTRRFAKALHSDLAIIDKRRPAHGEAKVMYLIGQVKNKNCVIIDDIIDSAGTISTAVSELKKKGAKDIYICATHGILSKNAKENLSNKDIKEVILTDTIQLPKNKKMAKIKIVSLTKFMAEILNCIYYGEPMGIVVENKYEMI